MGSGDQTRVSAIFTKRTPPTVAVGDFVDFLGSSCVIRLDAGSPAPEPAESLVVEFGDPGLPMVLAHLEREQDGNLHLAIDQFRRRDPREFPRVHAGLHVRYRIAPPNLEASALEAWLAEGVEPQDGVAWRRPEPFMDLSATGLGFDDLRLCDEGDELLLAFSLPGSGAPWRTLVRVMRTTPVEGEIGVPDPQVVHRVAVSFVRLPPEARQALVEKTIELLHLPGERTDPVEEEGSA